METRFGTNAVNIELKEALELNLNRVEFCLGGMDRMKEKIALIQENIQLAESLSIPYSIHLPVFLPDWFDAYFLDAYYLDPDPQKRDLSFRLLKFNLDRLAGRKCEYCVIHFPGIYFEKDYEKGVFQPLLKESLDRLETLAAAYGTTLLLEYFGSNRCFYDIGDWQREIGARPHLGILADTGHLFFASRIHGFDFLESLERLSETAQAFHLWTTRGDKPYGANPHYCKYHHIPMHAQQKISEGWAFDTEAAVRIIARNPGPAIMEASAAYGGKDYILAGIESLRAYFE